MHDLTGQVSSVLRGAGYSVHVAEEGEWCDFEDHSLMGRVWTVPSAGELLSGWKALQDSFLQDSAVRFRRDPVKAWNIYCVFLCEQAGEGIDVRKLPDIEENFRGARKIARAGVAGRRDIENALAPLLPLRNVQAVALRDARKRLAERLSGVSPAMASLLSGREAPVILSSLLERR